MAERSTLRLTPARPYSLERTLARFRRFPELVDRVEADGYRRLLGVDRRWLLVHVAQLGPPSRARLEVRIEGPDAGAADAQAAALQLVERALGAHAPLTSFYRRFRDDRLLGSWIRHARGLSVAGCASAWEALVSAVISQQVHLGLAYRIRRDLVLRYGPRARRNGARYRAFPPPRRLAAAECGELRALGLSRAKAETIQRLARAFMSGELSEHELAALDDEEVIERLTTFKGIGRWTAETTLIRGLARPDVFPAGDLGVIKHLAQGLLGHRERAGEDEMRRFAERWRPHRTLALIYGYAELQRRAQMT